VEVAWPALLVCVCVCVCVIHGQLQAHVIGPHSPSMGWEHDMMTLKTTWGVGLGEPLFPICRRNRSFSGFFLWEVSVFCFCIQHYINTIVYTQTHIWHPRMSQHHMIMIMYTQTHIRHQWNVTQLAKSQYATHKSKESTYQSTLLLFLVKYVPSLIEGHS
jgi:hypothetical protein